jgi:predicted acylesterase/phospholipase RssA
VSMTPATERPNQYSDMIMKGGITSGVIYPLTAVQLSKNYVFKNVGGTSAGAIASAAVAAAEHGRTRGRGSGFDGLAKLPQWLGPNLSSLFQPSRSTRPLFSLLTAGMARSGHFGRLAAVVAAAVRGFPVAAAAGLLPGLILGVAAVVAGRGFLLLWGLACAVILAVLGVAIALGVAAASRGVRALPDNFFGLCSGYADQQPGRPAPLTTWLADTLDELAGKADGEPLTFGDLWGSSDPTAERRLNLEMMTTNLTQGRPYRLPFDTDAFFFDPNELDRLFPKRIVDWMVLHARQSDQAERFRPLVPLPAAADLPVVVATRMSLSFPLLISAVPLHAVDYSRKLEPRDRRPERCWFSDGGITSNFPVHFFDAPLPSWPTFAVNLRPFHPDHPPQQDEAKNIWMPSTNRGGQREWWTRWEDRPPTVQLVAFGRSILDTMQNWMDNSQSRVPGYRDRVVHVSHTKAEGGMNLTMPAATIDRLTERGKAAGDLMGRRFAVPSGDGSDLTWDNHRWVRYRSMMSLLETAIARFTKTYLHPEPGDAPIDQLSRRSKHDPPNGYRWNDQSQSSFAWQATSDLVELSETWRATEQTFIDGAPRPSPDLRVLPRV